MEKESIVFTDESLYDIKVEDMDSLTLYKVYDVEEDKNWYEIYADGMGHRVKKETFNNIKEYLKNVDKKIDYYKTYAMNISTPYGKDKLVLYNIDSINFKKYRSMKSNEIVLYELNYTNEENENNTYVISKNVYYKLVSFFNK